MTLQYFLIRFRREVARKCWSVGMKQCFSDENFFPQSGAHFPVQLPTSIDTHLTCSVRTSQRAVASLRIVYCECWVSGAGNQVILNDIQRQELEFINGSSSAEHHLKLFAERGQINTQTHTHTHRLRFSVICKSSQCPRLT